MVLYETTRCYIVLYEKQLCYIVLYNKTPLELVILIRKINKFKIHLNLNTYNFYLNNTNINFILRWIRNKLFYKELFLTIEQSLIFIFVICLYTISLLLIPDDNLFNVEEDSGSVIEIEIEPENSVSTVDIKPDNLELNNSSGDCYYNSEDEELREEMKNKYIGIEDIRYLWPETVDDNNFSPTESSFTDTTQDTATSGTITISTTNTSYSEDNKPLMPFSPFTPNTLDDLNTQISKNNEDIKEITNDIDKGDFLPQDKRKLSDLLEYQEYYLNQHKNHMESLYNKDKESLVGVDNKLAVLEQIENQIKDYKENLNSYKDKLNYDITKYENETVDSLNKLDPLEKTSEVNDNNWKEGLSDKDIDAISKIDNKRVQDSVKTHMIQDRSYKKR